MSKLGAQVFAEGMALLAERWREFSPGMSRIYANAFRNAELTAEEFVAGIERAIQESTFCPNAKEIIAFARPEAPADVLAGGVFDSVLSLRVYDPRYGTTLSLDAIEAALGAAARHAVIAIGGGRRLVNLSDDALPFVLRDFAKAYAAFDAVERATFGSTKQLPHPHLASERKRLRSPAPLGDIMKAMALPSSAGAEQ